ncbi:PREDICTED: E3 ubiquitin-protein ligase ORTHRUS 1-like isoform X2 [Camelina sativa]|uniref:RING-type E3 ubiquitin transferase n=1 Tax=Camelina sativa TaxID=90675 RepID=A0ABM0TSH1_CAMSA|nr:PREDICTED: E3 ubiquitin-protein ligase ORTHRUS 1-like isoform X2 [Camelina sativa]
MAIEIQVPCDGDGVCMRCKATPPAEDSLTCSTCVTPWHVACILPESLVSSTGGEWQCPDCSGDIVESAVPVSGTAGGAVLLAAVRAIEADVTLTDAQKAKKRQKLMSGGSGGGVDEEDDEKKESDDEKICCSICIKLPERPVTTPCGHNFCLKCFEKWVAKGNLTCMTCRGKIPKHVAQNPRINLALVSAIRLAKASNSAVVITSAKIQHVVRNEDRPDKAFTTERAKKTGKANACSGKIYVTIPGDHFGPITSEYDPTRNQGVLVGESWDDRQDCRQWGAHFPHVAGIAGQSGFGAQSVALSGGYLDDEDHGEWFLYTGSGGRDLTGNKRTANIQSFDQKFAKMNEALRISCKMGYPVRVVRSHKEKRSAYAPEKGVRYDGVYRIEKCWRKVGIQGSFKVCRYLFVRCDNEAAPWASDVLGDRPRPLPVIPELNKATELFVRKEKPSWDFDEADGRWKWMKSPPASRKCVAALDPEYRKIVRKRGKNSIMDKLRKEFNCQICHKVMSLPVTTPCAHNFCKGCLDAKFAGVAQVRERSRGGRTLRTKKNVMTCHCCTTDLSEFLQNPQVNRELMEVIENLKKKEEESQAVDEPSNDAAESSGGNTESEEEEGEEEEEEAEPPSKKIKLDSDCVGPVGVGN